LLARAVANVIKNDIKKGKLTAKQIDPNILKKYVTSSTDNTFFKFKEGYFNGIKHSSIDSSEEGQWLRGYFLGRENSFTFVDKE